MTQTNTILTVLEILSIAYPDRPRDEQTIDLYLDHLSDIPAHLLRAAADYHIQHSAWFPKICELRQAAARLAGTDQFESLSPVPIDHLQYEAVALEDAFYHQHHLDPAEWHALAQKFEKADRPFRSAYTLEKLARLESIRLGKLPPILQTDCNLYTICN